MTPECLELIRSIKAIRDCLESSPNDPVLVNLLALEIDKLYSKLEVCYDDTKAA